MKRYKDLTNLKFEKLTVIKVDHFQQCKNLRRVHWLCECECGNTTVVRSDCLTSGNTKSCGCLNSTGREKPDSIKHHKLYRVYWGMRQRCYNPNQKHYNRYGGRGITVCDEWLNSYESFYKWAIDNGYSEGLTIDRINNDGNYEPGNCRWTTQKIQNQNKTQRKSTSHYKK